MCWALLLCSVSLVCFVRFCILCLYFFSLLCSKQKKNNNILLGFWRRFDFLFFLTRRAVFFLFCQAYGFLCFDFFCKRKKHYLFLNFGFDPVFFFFCLNCRLFVLGFVFLLCQPCVFVCFCLLRLFVSFLFGNVKKIYTFAYFSFDQVCFKLYVYVWWALFFLFLGFVFFFFVLRLFV